MRNINSDAAYDFLKKRILSGEYPPGRSLLTNVLASEIGVSRTPIRDALRQLEADGLVTIQPRVGASVKKMDVKTFRESCELRLALESHAAGLAARNRAGFDLQEISLALEEMRRITAEMKSSLAMASKLLPVLVREDVRFHLAIIGAAKNDLMKKEILRLHLVNRVVGGSSMVEKDPRLMKAEEIAHRQEVLESHARILRAIETQDSAAARQAMEDHIQDIINRSVHRLARATAEVSARALTEEEAIYST